MGVDELGFDLGLCLSFLGKRGKTRIYYYIFSKGCNLQNTGLLSQWEGEVWLISVGRHINKKN